MTKKQIMKDWWRTKMTGNGRWQRQHSCWRIWLMLSRLLVANSMSFREISRTCRARTICWESKLDKLKQSVLILAIVIVSNIFIIIIITMDMSIKMNNSMAVTIIKDIDILWYQYEKLKIIIITWVDGLIILVNIMC